MLDLNYAHVQSFGLERLISHLVISNLVKCDRRLEQHLRFDRFQVIVHF